MRDWARGRVGKWVERGWVREGGCEKGSKKARSKGKKKGEKKERTGGQRDLQRDDGMPEGVFLLLDSVNKSSMEDRAAGACQRRTAV